MDLKDGWIKKMIFNGLEANWFHNHFALTISVRFWLKTGIWASFEAKIGNLST